MGKKHAARPLWVQEQTLVVPRSSHVLSVKLPQKALELKPEDLRRAAGLK